MNMAVPAFTAMHEKGQVKMLCCNALGWRDTFARVFQRLGISSMLFARKVSALNHVGAYFTFFFNKSRVF
ncbi:hypothetical protein Pcar_3343 [Syntrophotalea carbinolica DSM 2380]|uniref:Uncharacterized protein n=1 Tax=Syntrophotalea carbinolica (strain DSM 2380 / NBRC 103641 / GraBd1) TaxID=338963 RepID=Q0C6H9_SYNC1|nr:hypothetical protein Pcar_3343 [Syntrophotalea carbinolica DSM 2380]